MSFWGIEVKPEKPYPYHSDDIPGRLHITQATLGLGSSNERSIVQCTVGHKSPIFLCSLLPGKNESCLLNLEFNEDDLVAFSVLGSRSVHLSGYFEATEGDVIRDDYDSKSDSYEENMVGIDSDESDGSEFDTSDEYGSGSSDAEGDDDFVMYSSSPVRNSGVVIEELEDDEKPENKQIKKKSKSSGSEAGTSSQQQIVVRGNSGIHVLESEDEDEDGFPISTKHESKSDVQKPEADVEPVDDKRGKKKKKSQDSDKAVRLKRKVESVEEGPPEKKKKKNKKLKEQGVNENHGGKQSEDHLEKQTDETNIVAEVTEAPGQSQSEEKKKKKKKNKKKGKDDEKGTNPEQTVAAKDVQKEPSVDTEEKQSEAKPSKARTYPNGLAIEEVSMGKPDGKRASPGKLVAVHYIGKLKKNGKIFDSNIGKYPFKFRLGTGQVISGWDVGVNGMRVGDKRRLTIPPEMGYGSKGAGGVIPPNAWLIFDVELVDVR